MVSFIIPAYNEELLLGATLRSVRTAGATLGEPYEIIVADDASTDRTAAVAPSMMLKSCQWLTDRSPPHAIPAPAQREGNF